MRKHDTFGWLLVDCWLLCAVIGLPGCTRSTPENAAPPADEATAEHGAASGSEQASDEAAQPAANVIAGRVTMADGSPLRGDVREIRLAIFGVSEDAEEVNYSPAVGDDGAYRQKVAAGQYRFTRADILVAYDGVVHTLPLEPVGKLAHKSRDAAEGMVQDFVWRLTGPTPLGQTEGGDPCNATHWYGLSIGLSAELYRNDIDRPAVKLPKGTRLTFTLQPTGPAIDGSEAQPVTLERTYDPDDLKNPDLNDLLPAPYTLSGTAELPDGTVKPLLLQTTDDYPDYRTEVELSLRVDQLLGHMAKPPVTFTVEE